MTYFVGSNYVQFVTIVISINISWQIKTKFSTEMDGKFNIFPRIELSIHDNGGHFENQNGRQN
jgi:hypothetical protein